MSYPIDITDADTKLAPHAAITAAACSVSPLRAAQPKAVLPAAGAIMENSCSSQTVYSGHFSRPLYTATCPTVPYNADSGVHWSNKLTTVHNNAARISPETRDWIDLAPCT